MMTTSEVRKDIPGMIEIARQLVADLEAAAAAEKKVDVCENLRSAMRASALLKDTTSRSLAQAQKCGK
jgi:hypothetical protein